MYDDDEAYILNDDGNAEYDIEENNNIKAYNGINQENLNEIEDFGDDSQNNNNNNDELNDNNNLLTNSLEDLNSQFKGKWSFKLRKYDKSK